MTSENSDAGRQPIPVYVPKMIDGRLCFVALSGLTPAELAEYRRKAEAAKKLPPIMLTCEPEVWNVEANADVPVVKESAA